MTVRSLDRVPQRAIYSTTFYVWKQNDQFCRLNGKLVVSRKQIGQCHPKQILDNELNRYVVMD